MRRIAKKKIPLSKLKKLRAEAVFKRDDYKCVRCGTTVGLSPSHVYPTGRYPRMAWMMTNILTLCWMKCHLNWWHKNPIEAHDWFKETFPDRYIELKEISKDTNLPKVEAEKVKVYLEEFIKELNI